MEKILKRIHFHIDGIVQGVGFRPFIYRIAKKYNLTGFVFNHSEGVEIEVQGKSDILESFINDLRIKKPPLSKIDNIIKKNISIVQGEKEFKIIESIKKNNANTLLPPDIATCDDCIKELFDEKDRRYRYPFINCMNCGPRYTIIHSIPYDRKNTTMNVFPLCEECSIEYKDPVFRRFHAEPNACEICGPSLQLIESNGNIIVCEDEISESIKMLATGKILAIKSLGGFHLACDGENDGAVEKLRIRKNRLEKPFAVMSFDLEKIKEYCFVSKEEEKLLTSPQRPIVLLRKKQCDVLSGKISPNNNYLGVMLAYNPVQLLLLKNHFKALVMTSGNKTEEPICIDNIEALNKLKGIADAFLINNRDINTRVDDSICFIENKNTFLIRRARGYVPNPIVYIEKLKKILAVGVELKNTIAISRQNHIFVSQHLGDLKNVDSYSFFTEQIEHLSNLLDLDYDYVAHDLHPDYLSTGYAKMLEKNGLTTIGIQHHKAHIASCIGDNQISPDTQVIGISLDGSGYGEDGTIWGGEFFVGNLYDMKRVGRFKPVPLPGGEKAIREPYRVTTSYLMEYLGYIPEDIDFWKRNSDNIPLIKTVLSKGINCPYTSSAGRFFDCISSLLGIRDKITFEGQAAIDLQMVSENKLREIDNIEFYPIDIIKVENLYELSFYNFFNFFLTEIRKKSEIDVLGLKIHKSICKVIVDLCSILGEKNKTRKVILSGGVFQNRILIRYIEKILIEKSFEVFHHKNIPCNDAGISLGQILLSNYYFINNYNKENI